VDGCCRQLPAGVWSIARCRHLQVSRGVREAGFGRPANKSVADCVQTFTEPSERFQDACTRPATCEGSRLDDEPKGQARLVPPDGGSLPAACVGAGGALRSGAAVTAVCGVCGRRSSLGEGDRPLTAELPSCPTVCANGPARSSALPTFECGEATPRSPHTRAPLAQTPCLTGVPHRGLAARRAAEGAGRLLTALARCWRCNVLDADPYELAPDTGVSALRELLCEADRVNFLVGSARNPGHAPMRFRQMGMMARARIVPLIAQKLEEQGKLVVIEHW